MDLPPIGLAAVYCIGIVLASLAGGWLPGWIQLTHSRMQTAVSFVAGVVLGIGLLHLLPHGFIQWTEVDATRAIDRSVWWLLMGFLATFFLQRLFHFHTHEAPDRLVATEVSLSAHKHDNVHGNHHGDHDQHAGQCDHRFTWSGVFFGLTVHSLVDGITLAAAIKTEAEHSSGLLAGFAYFLAVVLHKPFDSLSITSLMLTSGWSASWRNVVNVAYALVAPAGVLVFFAGFQQAGDTASALLAGTLSFAAGACVCIASSDLLPELQFHSHDRLKLSAALALGLALAWGLVYVENQGHDHHHGASPSSESPVNSWSHDHDGHEHSP